MLQLDYYEYQSWFSAVLHHVAVAVGQTSSLLLAPLWRWYNLSVREDKRYSVLANVEVAHFLEDFDCDSKNNVSVTGEWIGSTSLKQLLSTLRLVFMYPWFLLSRRYLPSHSLLTTAFCISHRHALYAPDNSQSPSSATHWLDVFPVTSPCFLLHFSTEYAWFNCFLNTNSSIITLRANFCPYHRITFFILLLFHFSSIIADEIVVKAFPNRLWEELNGELQSILIETQNRPGNPHGTWYVILFLSLKPNNLQTTTILGHYICYNLCQLGSHPLFS